MSAMCQNIFGVCVCHNEQCAIACNVHLHWIILFFLKLLIKITNLSYLRIQYWIILKRRHSSIEQYKVILQILFDWILIFFFLNGTCNDAASVETPLLVVYRRWSCILVLILFLITFIGVMLWRLSLIYWDVQKLLIDRFVEEFLWINFCK